MAEIVVPAMLKAEQSGLRQEALARVVRYVVIRAVSLFLTVVIGVYLSILIANMGGLRRLLRSPV